MWCIVDCTTELHYKSFQARRMEKNCWWFLECLEFSNMLWAYRWEHLVMQCPPGAGSNYFNYKGTFIYMLFVWVIDQVWGQDGWILDRDEVEVHKLAEKERGQYPTILTEQTWSIKDLLYGFRGNFSCGIQRVVPRAQDGSILPARVANHSARFGSSWPLAELAI